MIIYECCTVIFVDQMVLHSFSFDESPMSSEISWKKSLNNWYMLFCIIKSSENLVHITNVCNCLECQCPFVPADFMDVMLLLGNLELSFL